MLTIKGKLIRPANTPLSCSYAYTKPSLLSPKPVYNKESWDTDRMNDGFPLPTASLCEVTHLASPVDASAGEMNYGTFCIPYQA